MAVGCEGHGIVGPANRPTTGCPFTIFLPFSHSHSPFAHHDGRRRCKMAQCAITVHSFIHIPPPGALFPNTFGQSPHPFPSLPFFIFSFFFLFAPFHSFILPLSPAAGHGFGPFNVAASRPFVPIPRPPNPLTPSLCLSLFMLTGQCPLSLPFISLLFHILPLQFPASFLRPLTDVPLAKKPQSSNEAHRRPTTGFSFGQWLNCHPSGPPGWAFGCVLGERLDWTSASFGWLFALAPLYPPLPFLFVALLPFLLLFTFLPCPTTPFVSIAHRPLPFPPFKPSIEELLVVLPSFSSDRFIFLSFFLFGPKSAGPKPAQRKWERAPILIRPIPLQKWPMPCPTIPNRIKFDVLFMNENGRKDPFHLFRIGELSNSYYSFCDPYLNEAITKLERRYTIRKPYK